MSYYSRYNNYGTVTKREILFSIVIVSLMLLVGFTIHGNINDSLMLKYQEYNTALQIDNNKDMFTYGMRTNVGNAFVYGELKAVDPVTYPEIEGSYSSVRKVREEYRKHYRTVTKTRTGANGKTETYTVTEEYWTWDEIDSWNKCSTKITFCDVEFDYGTINFPYQSHIDTQDGGYHVRYVYYGSPIECVGTLYTVLENGTINSSKFYYNYNIERTIESLETGWQLGMFWFFWILLTGGCVILFCYLDNRWLEDKKANYYKRKYY